MFVCFSLLEVNVAIADKFAWSIRVFLILPAISLSRNHRFLNVDSWKNSVEVILAMAEDL